MASSAISASAQRALVEQWRETGPLLESLRHAELATQSAAESQRAAYDMLQLGGILPRDPARERSSGLLEMRHLFDRQPGRGRT